MIPIGWTVAAVAGLLAIAGATTSYFVIERNGELKAEQKMLAGEIKEQNGTILTLEKQRAADQVNLTRLGNEANEIRAKFEAESKRLVATRAAISQQAATDPLGASRAASDALNVRLRRTLGNSKADRGYQDSAPGPPVAPGPTGPARRDSDNAGVRRSIAAPIPLVRN